MAKRKREPKEQRYTEEIFFPCLGCYELAQRKLRQAKVLFRTSFHGSLFFEQVTNEIETILDDLMCAKMKDWKENYENNRM
jgi:hypothetical protein